MPTRQMLVDSHCHLDFPDFAGDIEGVLARARAAGVARFVTIGTKLTRFEEVAAIAEAHAPVWCSVGVHPHEAEGEGVRLDEEGGEGSLRRRLVDLSARPKVVGIGETGLDYFYNKSPQAAQQKSFRAHIEAAQESRLPLIVHTRDADADTARMLTEACRQAPLTGVMHCFSSGRQLAETAVELGFFISLSGILTFKNGEDLRATVKALPLDCLLVETDAPYLAPVPMRGKRNEPAFVAHTAKRLAELKGVGMDEITRITTANFDRLFAKAWPAP